MATTQGPSPLTTEFDTRTNELAQEVLDLLSRRTWPPGARDRGPRDPELRKNLGRLHTALVDARRLAALGRLDESAQAEFLARIGGRTAASLNADSAGELLEALEQELIRVGDELLLCSLLEVEYERDKPSEALVVTWSNLYSPRAIPASVAFRAGQRHIEDAELDEARNKLAALHRTRAAMYALSRARTMAKAKRLLLLPAVLLPVIVGVVYFADAASSNISWRNGALAAAAGALGASLSSGYALRHELPRIGQMRAFGYLLAAQPVLGAAAGLFLWLVVASGIVTVAHRNDDALVQAAVAFVAGFSEPFVLSTVGRVAGTDEKARVGSGSGRDGAADRGSSGGEPPPSG